MPSFLERLFRRRGKVSKSQAAAHSSEPPIARFTIPLIEPPADYSTELLVGVPKHQPRPPHRKGKRRTPEEKANDRQAFAEGTRAQAAIRHEYNAKRAEALGITHYKWLTGRGAASCATCRARNGNAFPYSGPEGFEHPGMVKCDDGDACRCAAAAIVPGFS